MSCKTIWDISHLIKSFSKYFVHHDLRKVKEKVLFEEEKTYLPQLQYEAEKIKSVNELRNVLASCEKEIENNNDNEDQMVRDQRKLDKILREKRENIVKLITSKSRSVESKEKKKFIMKCTVENCRGFLSEEYKCGLCNIVLCKDCHHEEKEEHKCNPDDVSTIKELKKTTRPCPKCHILIYKIDGCDQMFCIQCHTPFSWRTGEVESGVVHNPHYFEMLRKGQINDYRHRQEHGPCGPMPPTNLMVTILNESNISKNIIDKLYYFNQRVTHHRNVTLTQFGPDNFDHERLKYLLGEYTEEKFKKKIYVRNQSLARKREERQIMDTYVSISEEFYRNMNRHNVEETFGQIIKLINITVIAMNMLDDKYEHSGLLGLKYTLKIEQKTMTK